MAKRNPTATKCCCLVFGVGTLVGIICGIYALAAGEVWLKEDQQALMVGALDKYTKNGPGVVRFDPFWYKAEIRKGVLLSEIQYLRVTDSLTGIVRVVEGPKLFFAGAWETTSEPEESIHIQKNQYMMFVDGPTGQVRVLSGEQRAIPRPMETVLLELSNAIYVDDDIFHLQITMANLVQMHKMYAPEYLLHHDCGLHT